jgi:O-antigen ligase
MSDAAPKSEPPRRGSFALDQVVLGHLGLLVVFTSWAFGGQAPWARQIIVWWGTVGTVLFVVACRAWRGPGGRRHPALRLLWPLWLFDALVIASCFNPGMRPAMVAGEASLVLATPNPWLPSAAIPHLAARELWQFNGLVLSSFNLFLAFHRRSQVRRFLYLLAGNAVALAVFGTFQKLSGAKGLWFGLVHSPNERFFSTFIYHNHWGAFTLLNTSVCLALLFHFYRRSGHRDIWHSPVPLGAVVTLLLAVTIPLCASRSCTALAGLLLGGGLVHFLVLVTRSRRAQHRSAAAPVTAIVLCAVLATAAIGYLARGAISERGQQTAQQLSAVGHRGPLTGRLVLYRDTWHMAAAKPWFGWGLESYAHVFRLFNTQRANEAWQWIPFYAEAHNDWLQSLAEVGFVGTGLLALLVLLPWATGPGRRGVPVLARYLLGGCGVLLLYAGFEFPFANPAVMLTFCVIFYCATRYADLENPPSRHG